MGKSKAGRRAAQKAKKRAAKAEGRAASKHSDGTGGSPSAETEGKGIREKEDLADEERELMEQEDKLRQRDGESEWDKAARASESRYSQEGLVETIEKTFEFQLDACLSLLGGLPLAKRRELADKASEKLWPFSSSCYHFLQKKAGLSEADFEADY